MSLIPSVDPANLRMICKGVCLFNDKHCFTGDFYVLGFSGFDLLLGVDWLSKFKAVIFSVDRTISLVDDKGSQLVIKCKMSFDFIKSFVFSLDSHSSDINTIPVVQLFPDVFGAVTYLPPHREIEFRIDLIPEARPVVFPPQGCRLRKEWS